MPNASALERRDRLEEMARGRLDLLVVGGGITGVGIAWDACLRGMRVGLVEMQDFAAGTSSRSTKLIHGGLRYLESGDLALVREVGRERAVVHGLAPHVVRPLPMLFPLLPGARRGRSLVAFGTWLYDRLADVPPAERRRMLDAAGALKAEPLLRADVGGAALYYEYATDDARLTIEAAKAAALRGALAANYAEARGFGYDAAGRVRSVQVVDRLDDRSFEIEARAVVNAAGPWVDQLRAADRSLSGRRLRLSKGVHIVLGRDRLPLRHALYFEEADGRLLFAVPRGPVVYLGTTDTAYEGDPMRPVADREDVAYLLAAARAAFPAAALARSDIVAAWAGLRPLLSQPGRSTAATSRRDEILESPSGLISIAGGKLTGFRRMAERVVDRVASRLGRGFAACATAREPLAGGGVAPADLPARVDAWTQLGTEAGLAEADARAIAARYGTNAPRVLAYLTGVGPEGADEAMVRYAVAEEMAARAVDVVVRRTATLPFEPEAFERRSAVALARMTADLGWDGRRAAQEAALLRDALDDATAALGDAT